MNEPGINARSRDPAVQPEKQIINLFNNSMENQKKSKSIFIHKISNLMETKYDLKRLKIIGTILAVFFTVFMLGSYNVNAQSVTIDGDVDVCLGPTGTAVPVYTAIPVGFTTPTFTWSYATSYGLSQSGSAPGQFAVAWNTPTCNPLPRTQANWAWVQVTVKEQATPSTTATALIYVDLFGVVTSSITTTPATVCASNTAPVAIVGIDPACSIMSGQWKTSPPGLLVFANQNSPTTTILGTTATNVFTAGTYTITYTISTLDATGDPICGPSVATTTFTVNPMPEVLIASAPSPATVCFGSDVVLSATYTNVSTFDWRKDNVSIGGSATNVLTLNQVDQSGAYRLWVTSANGCGPVGSNTITVTINPLPVPAITASNVCFGNNISASVTGANFAPASSTFTWTFDGGAIGTSTSTSVVATTPAVGTHTFVVTVTNENGCIATATKTVTVNPLPVISVTAPPYCLGTTGVVGTVTGTNFTFGTSTVTWKIGGIANADADNNATVDISGLAVGTYSLVVTVTNQYGCSETASNTFTVNPLPAFTIVTPTPAEVCFNAAADLSVTLTAGVPSTYTVTWTVNGAFDYAGVNTNTYVFDGFGSATQTLTYVIGASVQNSFGCITTVTTTMTVKELPYITSNEIVGAQIAISSTDTYNVFCTVVPGGYNFFGKNITYSVEGYGCNVEFQWQWMKPGGSWENISVTANQEHYQIGQLTQTYTYKRLARTVGCDCTTGAGPWVSSNEITIYVVPPFVTSASVDDNNVCIGTEVNLTGTLPTSPAYATGMWTSAPATGVTFAVPSAGTTTATATVAGTYTLTWSVTNAPYVVGCAVSASSVSVAFDKINSVAAIAPVTKCIADPAFALVNPAVSVTGNIASQGYALITGLTGPATGVYTFNPFDAGTGTHIVTYTVVTTGGCIETVTSTITVTPLPSASIAYGSSAYCAVGTATASITGTTGGTFTAAPAGLTINSANGTIDLGLSTGGTYTVTYTFGVGVCTNTATAVVTVNALPIATISYPGAPHCAVGSVNVTQTGGTFTGTYTAPAGLSINGTSGAINLAGSTPGTYTVTYNFSNGTCSNSTSTSITVNALPTATISYGAGPHCKVGSVDVIRTGQAGGTYAATAGGLSLDANTGAVNLAASTVGTYTVTYSFTNGTCNNTATTSITVNALPTASISYAGTPYCNVGTATVTLSGQTGGTFSSTTGLNINAGTGAINLAGSTPGTYVVTYAFSNGTCSNTTTTSVEVLESPVVTSNVIVGAQLIATGDAYTMFCELVPGGYKLFGSNVIPSTGVGCDVQYRWQQSLDGGTTWNLFGENGQHLELGNLTVTRSFRREARIISCTCAPSPWLASNEITITVVPAIQATIGTLPASACLDGAVTLTGNNPPSYATGLWTATPSTGISFTTPTAHNSNVTATVAGTYTLTWTVTNNANVIGCSAASASKAITFVAAPTVTITPNPANATVCNGSSVTLTANATGASSYAWYRNDVLIGTATATTYAATTSGVYRVFVSNTTCTAVGSNTITVTVNPVPDVSVSPTSATICAGASQVLTATATNANSYLWYRNNVAIGTATGTTYTATEAGVYHVVVNSAGNCGPVSSNTSTVTVNALPVVTIAAIPTPVYYDDMMTVTANIVAPTGNANYSFSAIGSKGTTLTGTFNGTTTGTWTFDSFGLGVGTATVTVTVQYTTGTMCTSVAVSRVFTVDPPYYAIFSPTYLHARTAAPQVLNTIINDYVVEGVEAELALNPLSIKFNRPVHTANNLALPASDLGEFVLLQKAVGTVSYTWVNVPFTSTRTGNLINVAAVGGMLEYNSLYRIGFNNVYRPILTGGSTPGVAIEYTLDAQTLVPLFHNEANNAAYVIDNVVYFKTVTECTATAPSVFPTGTGVSICANSGQVKVEFVNPVRYLSGVLIATGDSPQHKFSLQRYSGSSWEPVPFTVVASNFASTANGSGPKTMTLTPATTPVDFQYGTQYRVVMNQYNPAGGSPYSYGFIDLVTGCNVLPNMENGWNWTTIDNYPVSLVVDPIPGYGNPNFNRITGYLGTISSTVSVNVGVNSPVMNITATPSAEGMRFTGWQRSVNFNATTPSWAAFQGVASPTFNLTAATKPACGESVAYKANFTVNTYSVTVTAFLGDNANTNAGTVTGGGVSLPHATTLTLTAKAKPGYYFMGWTAPAGFPGVVTNTTTVPADPYGVNDPTTATYSTTIILTGALTNGATYAWKANFGIFQPWLYAAAQGIDENGAADPNIVQVQFTTLFVSNIIQTGTATFTGDLNTYEKALFVYGNPDNQNVNFPVTVQPIETGLNCKYTFQKWERYNFATGVWSLESENKVHSFVPTQNYRLRAVYVVRTNINVSATEKDLTQQRATVIIYTDHTRTTPLLINNPAGANFKYGRTLYITSFPAPDYYTWRWEIGTVTNSTLDGAPVRYEDRSEWTYTVGCTNANLRAVVDLKEYWLKVRAQSVGTVVAGTVTSSTTFNANTGNQGGLGFKFNTNGTYGDGWFQRTKPVTFAATPKANFRFKHWVNTADGEIITDVNPYTYPNVQGTMDLTAVFESTVVIPEYTVVTAVNPAAGGTIAGGGSYPQTTTVTVSTVYAPGYTFTGFSVTGVTGVTSSTSTSSASAVFAMPANTVNVTANYTPTAYAFSTNVRTYLRGGATGIEEYTVVNYGGIVTPATATLTAGQTVQLTATALPGFEFVNWMTGTVQSGGKILRGTQISGTPNFTYTIPATYGNTQVVYAIFREIANPAFPKYALSTAANPSGYGTVTGDGTYVYGTQALVTQTPTQPGYKFDDWSTNVVGTSKYVVMDAAKTATAYYVPKLYQLNIWAAGMGTVSGTTSFTVLHQPKPVAAAPADGNCNFNYQFEGWFTDYELETPLLDAGGNVITSPEFNFIPYALPGNQMTVNIWAKFGTYTETYTVTAATALNTAGNLSNVVGTASVTGPVGSTPPYLNGTNLVVSTTPAAGYQFQYWTDPTSTLYITQQSFNHQVTCDDASFIAVYAPINYTVSATAQMGGTVTPAMQTKTIGQPVEVTAAANIGYEFDGWIANGVVLANAMANPAAFAMPTNNVTLQAKFKKLNWTVTATAETGGSVTPTTQTKTYGDAVTVTATAMAGYTFNGWVDVVGATVTSTMNPLSFTMPNNNVSLKASFVANPYTVAVIAVPANGGTFSALNPTYTVGQAVSVTATPAAGFELVSWSGVGITIVNPASPTITFNMPAGNVTLTATFAPTGNTLTGFVKYFNQFESMMPVGTNFSVGLFNGTTEVGTSTLDATGKYNFTGIQPGVAYTVKVMAANAPFGGVSAADALVANYMVIQSPILASFPWIDATGATPPVYTPFANKVADVNSMGGVTALDALTILYRTVNNIDSYPNTPDFQVAAAEVASLTAKTYPQAPGNVFSFAAGTYSGNWTGKAGQTIMNIYYSATGDVNASYVPQSAKAKVNLNYDGQISAKVGDVVSIPVTIDQTVAQLGAMTLGLSFNNSLLEVTGVEGYSVYNVDNANGTIRIAWMDQNVKNVFANENIVIITAKVLAPIEANTRYFEIDEAEFADRTAAPIDGITLTTKSITGEALSVLEAGEMISSAYPNPFKDMATINFTLPEAGKVTIVVYNKFGQEVKTLVNENREAGVQYNVELNSYDLSGSGTYFYRILVEGTAKTYTANGTLILVK